MAQIGALKMVRPDLAFVHREISRGIPGCLFHSILFDPKNLPHQPAKPLARSPEVKHYANKYSDH
jgi:hypothetical protein